MEIKYKIITLAAVSAVIIVTLILLIIIPLQNKNLALRQNILETRQNFTKQQIEIQSILKNDKTFKKIDVTEVNYIFLDKQNALFLINMLEKLAEESYCQLTISLSEPPENNDYKELDLELTLRGSLENLITFFNKIEEQNFYINYQIINITSAEPSPTTPQEFRNNSNDIIVKINAKTFWR